MSGFITPVRLLAVGGMLALGAGALYLLTREDGDAPSKQIGRRLGKPAAGTGGPGAPTGGADAGIPAGIADALAGSSSYAQAGPGERLRFEGFANSHTNTDAASVIAALDGSAMLRTTTDADDRDAVLDFAFDAGYDPYQVTGGIARLDDVWHLGSSRPAEERAAWIEYALTRGAASASE